VITFDEHSAGTGESRGIAHFGFRLVSPGDIDAVVDEVERAGAHCYAEANSAPASHTLMSTTRMVTKSKSGMSEAAGLVSCIYTKIAIFSYRRVQGSRPSWASASILQNKNGSSLSKGATLCDISRNDSLRPGRDVRTVVRSSKPDG